MVGHGQQMWDDLQTLMRRYHALQEAHLRCLDLGTVPDVEQLAFEQAQAFAALQNAGTAGPADHVGASAGVRAGGGVSPARGTYRG